MFKVGDLHMYKHSKTRFFKKRKTIKAELGIDEEFIFFGHKYRIVDEANNFFAGENGKILKLTVYGIKECKIHRKCRYPMVAILRKTHSVHRLVASAFIDNPNKYPCVNHKDGNKSNNTVENLEWVTYSQNIKHAYDVLNRKAPHCKLSEADIKRIIILGNYGVSVKTISESFEVSINTVRSVLSGKMVKSRKVRNICSL